MPVNILYERIQTLEREQADELRSERSANGKAAGIAIKS